MDKDNIFRIPSAREVTNSLAATHESTLDRIYRENGITHQLVAQQPKMKAALTRLGGLEAAAEYLRGSEDPDAAKFLEVYDRVDFEDHDYLEFEGFCAAARVQGKKIFSLIVAEAMINSETAVAIVTAIQAPDVIKATMDLAVMPGGHRERKLVAQAIGWLPRPKGSQTNLQINVAAGSSTASNPTGMPRVSLPSFAEDIRELGERFQANRSEKSPKILEGDV